MRMGVSIRVCGLRMYRESERVFGSMYAADCGWE